MWQQPCWNMPGIRESSLTRPNFTAHLHPFRGIRRNLQRMSSLGMRAGTPSWDSQVADQLKTMRGSWKNPFWGWHFTRVKDIDEEQGRLLDSQRKTYGQSVRSSDVYTQAFYVLGHPKSISTIALMGTFFPTPPLQRFLRFSPKPLGMPPSDWLHAPWI